MQNCIILWANYNWSTYLQCSTTIFSSSFQKIPFILKTVEADATWHLALWRRTFPDKKNWDWQGWDSLSDMNRFILKGLQGHIHSEVKIIFTFFIYIWFLFTLNFTITSTIHNYDKNLEKKELVFPGQFFTIICLKSSLKFSQVSQKTGLNDPHWVSHASHILNISLSFIRSLRFRMNYPGQRLVVSLNESKLTSGLGLPETIIPIRPQSLQSNLRPHVDIQI